MSLQPSRILRWLLPLVAIVPAAVGQTLRLTIGPVAVDRAVQVVSFPLPARGSALNAVRGADGRELPLQVGQDRTARFVIPEQKAGETLSFTLVASRTAPAQGVTVATTPRALEFAIGGTAAFAYQMDKDALPRPDIKPEYKRAGYLHPIYTPAGTVVSDDYPPQHVHHHGIWTPWVNTTFQGRTPDFWNMGKGTGTVEFVKVERTWTGPVHGGFVARHRFVDLSAKPAVDALLETWEVTGYAVPAGRDGAPRLQVFELTTTQTCATTDPLVLPKYHYGGFGFRGRGEWYGKDSAFVLTSEGTTDRVKSNHERMRWVHLWGNLPSGSAGLTVLGHPDNFRAPQPVRVHPNEPYVSFIPAQLGDFTIEPGKPYVARFRFVAFDGKADPKRLDALWNGYAVPPVVKLATEP